MALPGSTWDVLWKNPEDLTERQKAKLAWVATVNRRLYRAYLLKEQFRAIIAVKGNRGHLYDRFFKATG